MVETYNDIATVEKLPEIVLQNLIKADTIGDEIYWVFLGECLIKRKADFFWPNLKVNLDIRLKKNMLSTSRFDSEAKFKTSFLYDAIGLSHHEQVSLSGLGFERYFSQHRAT